MFNVRITKKDGSTQIITDNTSLGFITQPYVPTTGWSLGILQKPWLQIDDDYRGLFIEFDPNDIVLLEVLTSEITELERKTGVLVGAQPKEN